MRRTCIIVALLAVAGIAMAPAALGQVRQIKPVKPTAPKTLKVAKAGAKQTVQFAGAAKYRYLILVKSAGKIEISAKAGTTGITAALYSPKQKTPVGSAKGAGSLKLSADATAAEAGKEWMLELTANEAVSGELTIAWPGDSTDKIKWLDGLPTDPKVKAYLDRKLSSIQRWKAGQAPRTDAERAMWEAAAADPALAAGYTKLGASLTARKAAVAASTALVTDTSILERGTVSLEQAAMTAPLASGPTVTLVDPNTLIQKAETGGEGLGPLLRVRFLLLRCYEETTWDRGSDSDEPYILLGIMTDDGKVSVVHSDVFGDVDSGERRPEMGVADEILWEGRIKGESCFCMILMERDDGDWSKITGALEDAMKDAYTEFKYVAGLTFDVKQDLMFTILTGGFSWWLYLVSGGRADDKLGDIQSFLFTEQDVQDWWEIPTDYGNGKIYTTEYRGDGARYGVMLKLGL